MTAPRAIRWRGRRPTQWTVAGWSGMYDSKAASSEAPGQVPLLFNLRPADPERNGPLVLRPGMRRVLAGGAGSTALQLGTAGTRVCQAVFYMPKVGIIVILGGEIYTLNTATGTATKLVTQANFTTAGITLSTSTEVLWAFLGDTLVAADFSGRAWTWDGTAGAGGLTSLSNAPATTVALTVYYAKVFILDSSKLTVYWSEENQPNTGYASGGYNNAWELTQTSATYIRAILGTNEGLYVFREDSIGVIRGPVSTTFSTDGVTDSVFIGSGAATYKCVALAGSNTIWWLDKRNRMHAFRPGAGVIPAWQQLRRVLDGPSMVGHLDTDVWGLGEDDWEWWLLSNIAVDPVNRRICFAGYDSAADRRVLFYFDSDTAQLLSVALYPVGLNTPAQGGQAPCFGYVPIQVGGTPDWRELYVDEDGYVFETPVSGQFTSNVVYYDETHDGAGTAIQGTLLGPAHGWNAGVEYQFTQLDVVCDAALANSLSVGYLTSRRHKLSLTATEQTASDSGLSDVPYERRIAVGLNANGRWLRPIIRLAAGSSSLSSRQMLHGYTLTGVPVSTSPKVT